MLRASLVLGISAIAYAAYGQEAPSSALLPNEALVEHLAPQPTTGMATPGAEAAAGAEPTDKFITLTVPDVPRTRSMPTGVRSSSRSPARTG